MSDTSRGAAAKLTEERTNRMIILISIGIVFTLAVGGFCIAANNLGDQDNHAVDETVLDNFDLVETAQLDSEREIDFVLGSKSGEWVFDTEGGSIEVVDYYFPDIMPLCLTQEELDTWYVNLVVIGGYELVCGYIDVYQKGVHVGTIFVDWNVVHDDALCCVDYYDISFYGGPICLDSNQYPEVYAPFEICEPFDTIPGKEVTFDLYSCWTGCEEPDQNFAITLTHSILSFSKSMNLSTNGNTSGNQVKTVTHSNHIA